MNFGLNPENYIGSRDPRRGKIAEGEENDSLVTRISEERERVEDAEETISDT